MPREYQQVEYIRGTGTQYIITPITTRSTLTFDVTYRKIGGTNLSKVFGGQDANNNNCAKFYVVNSLDAATWRYGSTSVKTGRTTNNIIYSMHADPIGIAIDNGTVTVCVPSTFSSNIPIRLFDITNAGSGTSETPISLFVGDVFSFVITENHNKILDLVPCYRKSDNVAGMFDRISKTFMTNAGPGAFTIPQ